MNLPGSLDLPPGRFLPSGEYLCDECPFCGKSRHFYLNVETTKGHCFSCKGSIRNLFELRQAFAGLLEARVQLVQTREGSSSVLDRPELYGMSAWFHLEARMFLIGRRVSEKVCEEVPIWWIPQVEAMALEVDPVSPEFGPRVVSRRLLPGSKWIPGPGESLKWHGFGVRFIPRERTSVLLVEGIFDVLTPGLLGYAVGMMGTTFDEAWIAWLASRFRRVFLWFDPDEAGDAALKSLSETLEVWGVDFRPLRRSREPGDLSPDHPWVVETRKEIDIG